MFDFIVIKLNAKFQIQRLEIVPNVVSHKSGVFSRYLDIKFLDIICGDEDPNLYTGSWALFGDVDTSEEGQTIWEALEWRITYGKGGRVQFEEIILLG